jgi:two-component system, NarL family, nitrate/nitrite response regulator NarL
VPVPMEFPSIVRVVVADGQPLFRYGLKRLLEETPHLRVVGEVGHIAQAAQAVLRFEADVLVINPGTRGSRLAALKSLERLPERVRCIMVTNGDERYARPAVWPPPVDAALPRESPGASFVSCIQNVVRNERWVAREAAPPALTTAPAPDAKTPYRLTPREAQIVCAVADGGANKEIAAQLSISEDTVKHHLSNIFNKVGVDSRLGLVVFALYHGLVQWG